MKNKILLVEDDVTVRQGLKKYFESNGFQVLEAGLLTDAAESMKQNPQCVVLDWNLPDGEGTQLAREWSSRGVPIIMLTAKSDLVDRVLGLEVGAHDYLTKPFEPRELLARVKSLLRLTQSPASQSDSMTVHGVTLDRTSRTVEYREAMVELTKMEFDLLKVLMENPGKVFSRDELLNLVWGYDQFPATRTVDAHILQLRAKLSDDLIETVRGVGYRCKK